MAKQKIFFVAARMHRKIEVSSPFVGNAEVHMPEDVEGILYVFKTRKAASAFYGGSIYGAPKLCQICIDDSEPKRESRCLSTKVTSKPKPKASSGKKGKR
jgi:hypothetical protein